MAMDGSDVNLFPFLPYILQDYWEIGTDPAVVSGLIRKHTRNYSDLKVLDLGCGKGPVSVKTALKFKCSCLGIDAVGEFIDEASRKAKEYGVGHLCRFETGDIRERVKNLSGFDVIILGSIGPVFGDYSQTLTALKKCMADGGIIIIDDGYTESNSDYTHHLTLKQDDVYRQISASGFKLIDEIVHGKDLIKGLSDELLEGLKTRCCELMEKFPDKTALFKNYIQKQEEESLALEEKIICAIMVIKKT